MFTHLHVHTHYSLLEAIWSPKGYLNRAKELGMNALAITDYAGLYGAIEFYQAAKKSDIKPIIGVELGYVSDMHHKDATENAGTIVLLAKSYTGYENLLKIVSEAHLQGFHKIPRIDHACLQKYSSDLIALIWWPRSRLGKSILWAYDREVQTERLVQLIDTLGKEQVALSRYLQDTPAGTTAELNHTIQTLAKTHALAVVISGDVQYIMADDQSIYETALAIKDSKRIYDSDRRRSDGQHHLAAEEEITTWLTKAGVDSATVATMIWNNQKIAEMIDLTIPMDTILFPVYETPDDIKTQYAKRQDQLIISG